MHAASLFPFLFITDTIIIAETVEIVKSCHGYAVNAESYKIVK